MKKKDLEIVAGIRAGVIAKMSKRGIAMDILLKICKVLDCISQILCSSPIILKKNKHKRT